MDEQFETQQPTYISVIAVLPDNGRQIYSINPEITVADFIILLQNDGFISDLDQHKLSLVHCGKILQDEEKFSNFHNSNQILVYTLLQKISNAHSRFENSHPNGLIHNTGYLFNAPENNYNYFIQAENNQNFGNFAIIPQLFNYNFSPFGRQPMNDETPILDENNQGEVNPRINNNLKLIIIVIYFFLGFLLRWRSIIILIFICLFSSPKLFAISSLLEGMIARFAWNFITHYKK